jgi:hypothetical protein
VSKRARGVLIVALAWAILWAGGIPAQGSVSDPRLGARLDPRTLSDVNVILEEARADSLPTGPLVSKALEGAAKKAPGPRIVAAVRRLKGSMHDARGALGPGSTESELAAGAGALLAGVPGDTLRRLRAVRPRESLTVPLVVLADLVARKVPPGAASSAVLDASRAGVRDSDLLRMRESVERNIRAGASPAAALDRSRPGMRAGPKPNPVRAP